jgi:hypothetical protein
LRHHRSASLAELNEALAVLRKRLNNRPFRKRDGTLRRHRLTRTSAAAGATSHDCQVEDSPRLNGLSRRGRPSFLQRSSSAHQPADGGSVYLPHCGDLRRRQACRALRCPLVYYAFPFESGGIDIRRARSIEFSVNPPQHPVAFKLCILFYGFFVRIRIKNLM